MHNEAGQVSKGTALCTRVKWGLHIWQKNRSVHAAARLTLVYTVTQISKLNGDQRGQWSSCTAAWMRSWQTPPPLPLFRWCLLLHSDAHVGYRVSHLSNAWLQNTASTLSLSNYHELLWSAFTFCETDIQECCLWACADAQLIWVFLGFRHHIKGYAWWKKIKKKKMEKMCYSKNCSVLQRAWHCRRCFHSFFFQNIGVIGSQLSLFVSISRWVQTLRYCLFLCLVSALRNSEKHFRAKAFFSFSNILEIIAQYSLKCGGQGDHILGKLCFSDYLFAKFA